MTIRHEYKSVLRESSVHADIGADVARLAQYESAEGWDLVSFAIDSRARVHAVFRRAVLEKGGS